MRYMIRIYRYRGSYSALVPDLQGCVAVAKSVEAVCRLMAEAIGLHIDLMRQHGEVVPRPTQHLSLDIDEDTEAEFCTWVEVKWPAASPPARRRPTKRAPSRKHAVR